MSNIVFLGIPYEEPTRSCPVCHSMLNKSFGMGIQNEPDRAMIAGDITMCTKCKSLLIIQEDDSLALMPPDQLDRLPPLLQEVLAHMVMMDPNKPKKQ